MSKISRLHNSLREALKKQQTYFSPDELDEFIDRAQMDLFGKLIGNTEEYQPGRPVPVHGGMSKTQRIDDALQVFHETRDLVVGSSITALPKDYQVWISASIVDDSGNTRVAEVVDRSEWAPLLSRITAPPSMRNPSVCISNKTILVAPSSVSTITLSYTRRPLPPKYGYDLDASGRYIYNQSKDVEIEWSDLECQQIFHSALSYASTVAEDEPIAGLSQALKAKGE